MTKTQRIRFINRWAGGKVDPDAAYKALEALRKSAGKLTAERILEAAEAEDHPLHDAFEWDDAAAAHEYRLTQARKIVRAVVVTTVTDKGTESPPQRVYVHVPKSSTDDGEERGGFYEKPEIVAKNVDMFAASLNEALQGLRRAQERVNDLRRHAGDDEDRLAVITLIAQSLATAEAAFGRLH